MTSLPEILAAARPVDGGFACTVPETWLQGRTAYGGLSGALALHAALASEPDMPPLRSAQVAFVGPLAGEVTVTATTLRRGRNAAFIQADILGEKGLGYRATYVFMAAIESSAKLDQTQRAGVTPPGEDVPLYTGPTPYFTSNFNFLDYKEDLATAEWKRWCRLIHRDGLHPAVEVMSVADALPPAAMRVMEGRAPVSSLTWIVNLLDPAPATTGGWWLLQAVTDYAEGGYSSQRMGIWNADGKLIAEGMQGVAVFG